ncbi:MAG TPA: PAS domain-containing sensor histidine kinase, partial [Verrucomicrobiae bacterium]|nr:PAS domain-containing sensor histidine kinase [Verrucomicrobiae bacterium]
MSGGDQPKQTAEEALRDSEYRYRNLFQAMAASFWELDFTPVGLMLRDLRKQGITDFAAYFADNPAFVRQMMHVTRVIDVNDQTVALFGNGDKAELLQPLDLYWPEESNQVYAASVLAGHGGED